MVRLPGLEPGTHGLEGRCSSVELQALKEIRRSGDNIRTLRRIAKHYPYELICDAGFFRYTARDHGPEAPASRSIST